MSRKTKLKTPEELGYEEANVEKQETKQNKSRKVFSITDKNQHRMIMLILLHLFYIVFESLDVIAGNEKWISAIIYGILSLGTIICVFFNWENAKFFIPIPFLSLSVVGGILEISLFNTILFGVYIVFYFVMAIWKKSEINSNITMGFSALNFLCMTIAMIGNRGFTRSYSEFNVVLSMFLVWFIASTLLTILNRKEISLNITYIISTIAVGTISPFIEPEGIYSNLFVLFCAITIFISSTIVLTFIFAKEIRILYFTILTVASQIGFIILSYSFAFGFKWIEEQTAVYIVHYGIFLPFVIYLLINMTIKLYQKDATEMEKYQESEKDSFYLLTSFVFIVAALAMYGWIFDSINLINALIISVAIFATGVSLKYKISTTTSMILSYLFLALTLHFVASMKYKTILLILIGFSGLFMITAIFNELYLGKEPMTSSLSFSGSLAFAVCIFLYFEAISFWISICWAFLGMYIFSLGIFFNKILHRRAGLAFIMVDIIYTIVYLSVELGASWQLGLGITVLALVLFFCIYLFRWSEQREKLKKQELGNEEKVETT